MDRPVAHPESRQIGRVDRAPRAERPDQRLQGAAGGEAVDQDDRGSAKLGPRAVVVRAVRVPGGLPLELGRHAHEDSGVSGARPTPVYAVSTPYLGHLPLNIAATCGGMVTISCFPTPEWPIGHVRGGARAAARS